MSALNDAVATANDAARKEYDRTSRVPEPMAEQLTGAKPLDPLTRMGNLGDELRTLTGDSVHVELSVWSYKHDFTTDETSIQHIVYSSAMGQHFYGDTIEAAAAACRAAWEQRQQPEGKDTPCS